MSLLIIAITILDSVYINDLMYNALVQQYHTTLFTCQATIIFIFSSQEEPRLHFCTASIVNKICLH